MHSWSFEEDSYIIRGLGEERLGVRILFSQGVCRMDAAAQAYRDDGMDTSLYTAS
jgi:hypothetical protein